MRRRAGPGNAQGLMYFMILSILGALLTKSYSFTKWLSPLTSAPLAPYYPTDAFCNSMSLEWDPCCSGLSAIEQALHYDGTTCRFFLGSPRRTKRHPARRLRQAALTPSCCHTTAHLSCYHSALGASPANSEAGPNYPEAGADNRDEGVAPIGVSPRSGVELLPEPRSWLWLTRPHTHLHSWLTSQRLISVRRPGAVCGMSSVVSGDLGMPLVSAERLSPPDGDTCPSSGDPGAYWAVLRG